VVPPECGADEKSLPANVPQAAEPVELYEIAPLQRGEQAMGRRRRQARAPCQIGEAEAVIVLAEHFEQHHCPVDRLHIVALALGLACVAGIVLGMAHDRSSRAKYQHTPTYRETAAGIFSAWWQGMPAGENGTIERSPAIPGFKLIEISRRRRCCLRGEGRYPAFAASASCRRRCAVFLISSVRNHTDYAFAFGTICWG
jgi:hypothetical protein